MKFSDLLQKDAGELYKICTDLKRAHMNMRLLIKTGQEVKTSAMRACRKDVARVKTRLTQLAKKK
ncbi:MAG: 50S ribosomal protein L29 [Holosporales bacterium]|jgi:large subunit ribosomal protein L29|nr:50S ribosomal protein L29 [Holosporales bacterium]